MRDWSVSRAALFWAALVSRCAALNGCDLNPHPMPPLATIPAIEPTNGAGASTPAGPQGQPDAATGLSSADASSGAMGNTAVPASSSSEETGASTNDAATDAAEDATFETDAPCLDAHPAAWETGTEPLDGASNDPLSEVAE